MRLRTWQIVALVGIAALAVALRLTLLTEMPASLFRDEARHALKAARILDDATYRPVYEPEISLPALFLYPLALAFKIFGVSMLTLRLFMASVGVADVLLFFFLARRLFGTRVGLIAAYLFAVAFWALRMQRVALAPCFSTGLVLLGLLLFVRAVQTAPLVGLGAGGRGRGGDSLLLSLQPLRARPDGDCRARLSCAQAASFRALLVAAHGALSGRFPHLRRAAASLYRAQFPSIPLPTGPDRHFLRGESAPSRAGPARRIARQLPPQSRHVQRARRPGGEG